MFNHSLNHALNAKFIKLTIHVLWLLQRLINFCLDHNLRRRQYTYNIFHYIMHNMQTLLEWKYPPISAMFAYQSNKFLRSEHVAMVCGLHISRISADCARLEQIISLFCIQSSSTLGLLLLLCYNSNTDASLLHPIGSGSRLLLVCLGLSTFLKTWA